MRIKLLTFLATLFTFILSTMLDGAQFSNISNCLVMNNIGIYSFKAARANMGYGSGAVGMAGHFDKDHNDQICTGTHSNINELRGLPAETIEEQLISVKVQVTQHTNSDSDMWLLHEVDAEFRNYYGIPGLSYSVKKIDGNTILQFSSGGRDYRWISGNKVIKVEYHDSQMTKPEPLEIVKAYLAKHPSTIQPFTLAQLRSSESKTKWIKDEMDRRLWICDKWFYQLQLGKVALKDVIWNTVRSMTVFLNYREKYYGIDAENDLAALNSYQRNNDGSSIKLKLQEYKNWWLDKKGDRLLY